MNKRSKLHKILEFVKFTHKFQQVERLIYLTGADRDENDAEHSFQLAMLAWYIIDTKRLNLDKTKIFKYALAHDLVEVYAGDTYFYSKDKTIVGSKAKREEQAAKRISKEFHEFKELHTIIQDYESRLDPEAKFIYALDKIIPAINVYLDNGRSWQRDNVAYDMVRTKDRKVAISKEATEIWEALVEVLDKNKHLFAKSK